MQPGKCQDLSSGPGLNIEAGLARGLIEKIERHEVEVRDETGSVVATATTDSPAELVSAASVHKAGSGLEACLAGTPYRLQLPTALDSFVFSLPGVPGSPPSISLKELEAREFKCDLHIVFGGKLFDEDACGGGDWAATLLR